MEKQRKEPSGNDNRHKRPKNNNTNDNTLKKRRGLIIYLIFIAKLIVGAIIILNMMGCTNYKEQYNTAIAQNTDITNECNNRIINYRTIINQTNQTLNKCLNKPTTCECNTQEKCNYLQFENELLRYSTTIKKLTYDLSKYNNTNYIQQLEKNNTNLKYAYQTCNETLTQIKEII